MVAITELAGELGEQGLENVADPNIGGTVEFDGGWVRLTPAWHTSTSPNGTVNTPAGLVINLGGKTVYHVGDTALFSDLRLAGERDDLDAAIVCIGGHYTMDRHDAAVACEWIGAPVVIPCHYDTFPPIETDAQAFKADVEERTGARRPSRCSTPAGRSASSYVLGAAREPDRAVLPVVRDEGGAERREQRCRWRRGGRAGRRSRRAGASGRNREDDYRVSMASALCDSALSTNRHFAAEIQPKLGHWCS